MTGSEEGGGTILPTHGPGLPAADEPARILVVAGTRPEAIKMAPVLAGLRALDPAADVRLALTGQHSDLVDSVLDVFDLTPDFDLAIMKPGQSLYDVAARCLEGMGPLLREFRPHEVLVQGDTATVFFASLAAFFEGCRVGHVEAGLRSGQKWSPFPEEIFRRLTDVVADHYFAPTPDAASRLLAEGVPGERVFVTGNTVVDALEEIRARGGGVQDPRLASILAESGQLALMTAHRRESFGGPLRDVFGAVRELVERESELTVVYPVHPNPNVIGSARELLSDHPRIHLLEPLDYLDLVRVMAAADLILTDSGGIQEEAPTFGVPTLVLREVTERPEGVAAGAAVLVGTDPERILTEAQAVLQGEKGIRIAANPYGDGRAGRRIADIVLSDLAGRARTLTDWSPGHPG